MIRLLIYFRSCLMCLYWKYAINIVDILLKCTTYCTYNNYIYPWIIAQVRHLNGSDLCWAEIWVTGPLWILIGYTWSSSCAEQSQGTVLFKCSLCTYQQTFSVISESIWKIMKQWRAHIRIVAIAQMCTPHLIPIKVENTKKVLHHTFKLILSVRIPIIFKPVFLAWRLL